MPKVFYRSTGKRLFDLLIVIATSPLTIPVVILIALLVRFKLGGPVFFVQERPGKNATPFRIIKFRSMTDERNTDGTLKPDAERLTRFGKLLRSSSLDELPELWNILKGEMSIVGPRPLLMRYVSLYSKKQFRRHEMRPGITGLAQVSGRNLLSWDEKFALDVTYIETSSLALDIKIILRTVLAIFSSSGISAEGEATMPYFTGNARQEDQE